MLKSRNLIAILNIGQGLSRRHLNKACMHRNILTFKLGQAQYVARNDEFEGCQRNKSRNKTVRCTEMSTILKFYSTIHSTYTQHNTHGLTRSQ